MWTGVYRASSHLYAQRGDTHARLGSLAVDGVGGVERLGEEHVGCADRGEGVGGREEQASPQRVAGRGGAEGAALSRGSRGGDGDGSIDQIVISGGPLEDEIGLRGCGAQDSAANLVVARSDDAATEAAAVGVRLAQLHMRPAHGDEGGAESGTCGGADALYDDGRVESEAWRTGARVAAILLAVDRDRHGQRDGPSQRACARATSATAGVGAVAAAAIGAIGSAVGGAGGQGQERCVAGKALECPGDGGHVGGGDHKVVAKAAAWVNLREVENGGEGGHAVSLYEEVGCSKLRTTRRDERVDLQGRMV